MFEAAVTLAQVTQSSQRAWATTYLNLGTCYRKLKSVSFLFRSWGHCLITEKHRRYEDAQATYLKVLELDSRNAVALGFLGIVYHLLGDLDGAIVKYHEVRIMRQSCKSIYIDFKFVWKALSIDPINAHLLELLNTALESSTAPAASKTAKPLAVGSEFKNALLLLRAKYEKVKQLEIARAEQGHEMLVG